MPSTFQMYYDLLLKKLTNGSGEPIALTDAQMQQAIEEVKRQIREMGPNPQNLDASFDNFCATHPFGEINRRLRPDSNTIGPNNISRYEYSELCRNEVMKNVEFQVRQELEWRSAVKRLGLTNDDGTIKEVGKGRWLGQLIKTDGSEESLKYNETIVALAALGNKVIDKNAYLNIRKSYHILYDKMNPDDAEKAANGDFDNRTDFLFSEVENAVESGREKLTHYNDAANAIRTGDFSNFGGSVEQAFNVFFGNSESLAMVGYNMFEDLTNKFGLKRSDEEKREITNRWQNYTLTANSFENVAEQVSNPYFAIFDPYKYYRVSSTTQTYLPTEEADESSELAYSFMRDGIACYNITNKNISSALKQYALSTENEIVTDRTDDFNVYMKEDRVVILKIGQPDADGAATCDERAPEQLVTRNAQATVNSLLARCGRWSKTFRTSKQFENMRESLEALEQLGFEDGVDIEKNIHDSAAKFEELRADAQAYIERKLKQHPDKVWDGDYEAARVQFAMDVLKFASTKLRQIGYYSMFEQTVAMRVDTEREAWEKPEWRDDPRYAGMSPMEHKQALRREQLIADEAKERQQREAAEAAVRAAENAFRLADGRQFIAGYDRLFEGIGEDAGDAASALTTVEQFAEGYKNDYNTHLNTLENDKIFLAPGEKWSDEMLEIDKNLFTEASYLIAGYVIAEMLNGEQAMIAKRERDGAQGEVKTPIRQLVNAGKTKDLADMIIKSAHFKARFAERLSNPEDVKKLIEGRNTLDRPTRRDCYRAGMDFLDNIELARKNPIEEKKAEPKAEQVPVKENAEKKEAEKKPEENPNKINEDDSDEGENLGDDDDEELSEDDVENNNHINIIDNHEKFDRLSVVYEENENREEDINPEKEAEKFNSYLKGYINEAGDAKERPLSAEIILNHDISNSIRTYRFLNAHESQILKDSANDQAKLALAGATLKYMIRAEAPSEVLRDTVERGKSFAIISLIANSAEFEENYKKFSSKQIDAILSDDELFCRPVGDALLATAKKTLESEGLRIDIQRSKERKQLQGGTTFTQDEIDIKTLLCKNIDTVLGMASREEKCDWAKGNRLPYETSPYRKIIADDIEENQSLYSTFIQNHARSIAKSRAASVLAAKTLQYMIEADPTGMVLEDAVERGQYEQLIYTITESRLFKNKFDYVEINDEEKFEDTIDDDSLFAKPVGDKFLSMMKSSLEHASINVAEQKKKEIFGKLKSDIDASQKKAEQAYAAGKNVLGEKYGKETIALQTTHIMLMSTDKKGELPKCSVATMTHMVKDSKPFTEEVGKFDLKKQDELKKAVSQRIGVGIVKSIITAEKQKENDKKDLAAGKAKVKVVDSEKQNSNKNIIK
jgi:hypothetical protein